MLEEQTMSPELYTDRYQSPLESASGAREGRVRQPFEAVDQRERIQRGVAHVPDRDAQLDDLPGDDVARGRQPERAAADQAVAEAAFLEPGARELRRAER